MKNIPTLVGIIIIVVIVILFGGAFVYYQHYLKTTRAIFQAEQFQKQIEQLAGSDNQNEANQNDDWKTYVNNQYMFEVKYPKNVIDASETPYKSTPP